MMNEPSSEANSDKLWVDAICIYCNKRFTSMRSVGMHLKWKANRHAVNFINYGNYCLVAQLIMLSVVLL
jgi:hypothetical protein